MDTAKKIRASFEELHAKIKSGEEISEEDLRVAFVKCGILEVLGYEEEFKDIRFEKSVRGKRSDLLAFDDYQNVVFVVKFKRPNEINYRTRFCTTVGAVRKTAQSEIWTTYRWIRTSAIQTDRRQLRTRTARYS